MAYLLFTSLESAQIANATIALNMGLTGNATTQWTDIIDAVEGYCIDKPAPMVQHLDPVFVESGMDEDNNPIGTWTYPTKEIDTMIDVIGYAELDEITLKPVEVIEPEAL